MSCTMMSRFRHITPVRAAARLAPGVTRARMRARGQGVGRHVNGSLAEWRSREILALWHGTDRVNGHKD